MTFVIDTPAGMAHWVYMSRLFGLVLEINTNGKVRTLNIPVLTAMAIEGTIPKLRNTQKNRGMVLRTMVAMVVVANPSWMVPPTVLQAMLTDDQKKAQR